jgi:2-hydroxymuconate-semialdehyde hydrolase
MQANQSNPEIGQWAQTGSYRTNYHRAGSGAPLLLLHGSGAGVSAWANWRGVIGALQDEFDIIAPDLLGFGYTEQPEGLTYRFLDSWIEQIIGLLDHLGIEKTSLVGNSFGGALALHLASRYPERYDRVVLMGTSGVAATITTELDELWGYTPSRETMQRVLRHMIYDHSRITDELVEMRYQGTLRPGVAESFAAIFPAPRQRWWDAMVLPEEKVRALSQPFLMIHGRDDKVCPPASSQRLLELIPDSQLHMFARCGHWAMIEHQDRFHRIVRDFVRKG